MEYVKILCCGKENGELGTLSLLLDRMTSVFGITIKNMKGVCFADFTQEEVDEENEEYQEPFRSIKSSKKEANYQCCKKSIGRYKET